MSVPRSRPRWSARSARATTCDVNAFVEATPISGPAWVSSVPAASRVSIEPWTLQMAMGSAPRRFASRNAASVSAVSPLWEMATARVPGPDDGRPIPELAPVVDLRGDPGDLLQEELADESRVPARPARDEDDPLRALQAPERGPQLLEEDLPLVEADPARGACRAPRAAARGSP